jgi:hypothetical protein
MLTLTLLLLLLLLLMLMLTLSLPKRGNRQHLVIATMGARSSRRSELIRLSGQKEEGSLGFSKQLSKFAVCYRAKCTHLRVSHHLCFAYVAPEVQMLIPSFLCAETLM